MDKTYTAKIHEDAIRIRKILDPRFTGPRANIANTTSLVGRILRDQWSIGGAISIPGYAHLSEFYAYAKTDDPDADSIFWSVVKCEPEEADDVAWLKKTCEKNTLHPLIDADTGFQLAVITNMITPVTHGDTQYFPVRNYAVIEEKEDDFAPWEPRLIHVSDPSVYGGEIFPIVDYIFGLTELRGRIDAGNISDDSVLVITYRGDEYQTREHVLRNAIRKGFGSTDIHQLIDLLGTGKVVFAGDFDFYVGRAMYKPRGMTINELAKFELSGGRDPKVGFMVGEDAAMKLDMYLTRDKDKPYRWDENVHPLRLWH